MRAYTLRNSSSIYFGKISSRGDFIKSASGTKVIALIDDWVANGMEMLIAEPGWKTYYDTAEAIDFLFIGIHKKHAICGSLIPSEDAASRRFPFIAATLFEVDGALTFLPLSPLILERHTNHRRGLIHHAAKAHDATDILTMLGDVALAAGLDSDKYRINYESFLADTTISNLTVELSIDNEQATVRQMILAIGYLLQPVLTNYTAPPQKALSLPLPRNPGKLALIKTFWLDLICSFLPRAEFEISIFSAMHRGEPRLIVTFNGVTPLIFQALFDEQAAKEMLIDIGQAVWAEEHAIQEQTTLKLSSYLEHPELSLHQLVETFRQGFTGQ